MAHFYVVHVNAPNEKNWYGPFDGPNLAHHAVHVIASRQKGKGLKITIARPSRVTLKDSSGRYYMINSELFHSNKQSRIDAMVRILKPFK